MMGVGRDRKEREKIPNFPNFNHHGERTQKSGIINKNQK
jgi:hypothetical protein